MSFVWDTEESAADIAIVGLGPGGLAAALEAASRGKNVLAFTDRNAYIRGQRLILLSLDTVTFLRQHTIDSDPLHKEFWQKYDDDNGIMQLKDIERFLEKKLHTYPNVTIVPIEKPAKIISIGFGETKKSSFIELSTGRRYFCQHILAADGGRHAIADIVNTQLESDIQYKRSDTQERYPYHGTVQLRLKLPDYALLKMAVDPTTMARAGLKWMSGNEETLRLALKDTHESSYIRAGKKLYYYNGLTQNLATVVADDEDGDYIIEVFDSYFKEPHSNIKSLSAEILGDIEAMTGHATTSYDELNYVLGNQNACIEYEGKLFYFDSRKAELTPIPKDSSPKIVETMNELEVNNPRMATYKEKYIIASTLNQIPSTEIPRFRQITKRALNYINQGWTEGFQPKNFIMFNLDETKAYFAGEIPKSIFDAPPEERKKLLHKWACLALMVDDQKFEYKISSKSKAKDYLQATVFEMNIVLCQKPVVDLCGGGVFSQIGDARRTPDFYVGHGLNDAIECAIAFVDNMQDVGFDKEGYTRHIDTVDERVDKKIKMENPPPPDETVLSKAIDKLIAQLEKIPGIDPEYLMALKWGKNIIQTKRLPDSMYAAMAEIKPIIERYQERDTLEQIAEGITDSYHVSATKVETLSQLYDHVDNELHTQFPSLH